MQPTTTGMSNIRRYPSPTSQPSQSWGAGNSSAAYGGRSSALRVAKSPENPSGISYTSSYYASGAPSNEQWVTESPRSGPSSSTWSSSQATVVGAPTLERGLVWPASLTSSSQSFRSPVSLSSASSTLVGYSPVGRSPSVKSANINIRLHPMLEPGHLWCDFAYPPSMAPSTRNFNPNGGDFAFYPALSDIGVFFPQYPGWSLRVASSQPLTVYAILFEIFNYLQQIETQDVKRLPKIKYDAHFQSRDPQSFHRGLRRIDLLGRCRVFYGMSAVSGNTWNVTFCEPSS